MSVSNVNWFTNNLFLSLGLSVVAQDNSKPASALYTSSLSGMAVSWWVQTLVGHHLCLLVIILKLVKVLENTVNIINITVTVADAGDLWLM